ncbi:MAG: tetratricopeptide repeat protein [Vulcanococcus sp.]
MPSRASTVPRPGLLLPLGAAALVAASLAAGWWLGQRNAPALGARSRSVLESQAEQLQTQVNRGSASEADRQRLLELLLALGQQRQATVLLEQMADQQPERWQLRLLLAELRRNGNDRSGAERELRQLLNLRPDRIEALQLMTLLQLEQGRGSQAQAQLKALLDKASKPTPQPQAIGIGLLLGDLLQRQGQQAEAAALYIRLAGDFSKDPRPLLALALLRQEQGDGKGAQEALAQARNRQPDQANLRLDQVASTWGLSSLRKAGTPALRAPSPAVPTDSPPEPVPARPAP